MNLRKSIGIATNALLIVFFALFFFLPIYRVLIGGFSDNAGHFTTFYVQEVFRNPVYMQGLLNSFLIALCTTILSALIAMPLAWLSDRYDFAGKKLLTGCRPESGSGNHRYRAVQR